jgi:hypothetical protein
MRPIDDNIETILDRLFKNDKLDIEAKKTILKELLKVMLDLYETPMSRKCVNGYLESKVLDRVSK